MPIKAAAHPMCGPKSEACKSPDIADENEWKRVSRAFRRCVELGQFVAQFAGLDDLAQIKGTSASGPTAGGDERIRLGNPVRVVLGHGLWKGCLRVVDDETGTTAEYECWLTVRASSDKVTLLVVRRKGTLRRLRSETLLDIAEDRLKSVLASSRSSRGA